MFIEIVVKHQKNLNTLLFDFGPSFRLLLPNVDQKWKSIFQLYRGGQFY
jgi:hypothetical protein